MLVDSYGEGEGSFLMTSKENEKPKIPRYTKRPITSKKYLSQIGSFIKENHRESNVKFNFSSNDPQAFLNSLSFPSKVDEVQASIGECSESEFEKLKYEVITRLRIVLKTSPCFSVHELYKQKESRQLLEEKLQSIKLTTQDLPDLEKIDPKSFVEMCKLDIAQSKNYPKSP